MHPCTDGVKYKMLTTWTSQRVMCHGNWHYNSPMYAPTWSTVVCSEVELLSCILGQTWPYRAQVLMWLNANCRHRSWRSSSISYSALLQHFKLTSNCYICQTCKYSTTSCLSSTFLEVDLFQLAAFLLRAFSLSVPVRTTRRQTSTLQFISRFVCGYQAATQLNSDIAARIDQCTAILPLNCPACPLAELTVQ